MSLEIENKKKTDPGTFAYELAQELFPFCRSITGNGVRQTLKRLQHEIPELKLFEVPTGTQVFDWTIPKEWNIRSAYIDHEDGERILDFSDSNLHVVGYSIPVDKVLSLDELQQYLYSLQEQPEWIPYVTSYYKERFGFCIPHRKREELRPGNYHIYIDSQLEEGSLTYGELIIKGKSDEEIFLSTYICHPSMANNELSGPCLTTALVKWIKAIPDRRYTYRIIFVPETIGAITYISRNINEMKRNIVAGFNISCVGDNRAYSYLASREENTLSDRIAKNILNSLCPGYVSYTFLKRGSDERQYCAPGVDLPICSVMRSKYGEYPEYHTSADDLSLISPEGFQGIFNVYVAMIAGLESNYYYNATCLCEPQLGKRGLYPTISYTGSANDVTNMSDFLAYADGKRDLLGICELIGIAITDLIPIADKLHQAGLVIRNGGDKNAE